MAATRPDDTRTPIRASAARPRFRPRFTIAVVLTIFVVLQVMSFFTPDYLIPSPYSMLRATFDLLYRQSASFVVTLVRVVLGVVASLVLGSALGAAMGLSVAVAGYSESLMFVLSGVPALSWMLLAVLWFPYAEARIFFVLFVILFPFYALNVYEGIRALPKDFIEMLDVFRPTRWQVFKVLIVPQIVPYVLLTTKSLSGFAIRMAVFAELIGAATGVGARLAEAQGMLRVDRVFAWTILLVVLNFALQHLVSAVDRRLLAWRPAVEIR